MVDYEQLMALASSYPPGERGHFTAICTDTSNTSCILHTRASASSHQETFRANTNADLITFCNYCTLPDGN